jgi:hypothetical protein
MKLAAFEKRAARAALCAIFPADGDPRISEPVAKMDLESFFDYAVSGPPFVPAMGYRITVWILMLAPIFVLGRLKTIASCTPDEADEVVAACVASRVYFIRQLVVFFKAFGALYYFTSPRVRDQVLGHDRPALAAKPDASSGDDAKAAKTAQELVQLRRPNAVTAATGA